MDLWITPQGQGYPQAPPSLGQRKNSVAHITTATTAAFQYKAKNNPARFDVGSYGGCFLKVHVRPEVAVADCILYGRDYAAVLREYSRRYPAAGCGRGFTRWLQFEGAKPNYSYGNGSAMRVSPVGWACNTLEPGLPQFYTYAGGIAQAFYGGIPSFIDKKVRRILPPDLLVIVEAFEQAYITC